MYLEKKGFCEPGPSLVLLVGFRLFEPKNGLLAISFDLFFSF